MPHDLPLLGGHIPGSDEDSKKLNELTVFFTKLSDKVTSLEEDLKQTKKLYDEGMDFVHEKDAETQEKIGSGDTEVLDIEEEISTANVPVSTASASETISTAAPRTPPTTTTVFDDEDISMAMAQTLIKIKEELARKLHDEELAKAAARKEHERTEFEKALELQKSMNYKPIVAGVQTNDNVGTITSNDAGPSRKEKELVQKYMLLPFWVPDPPYSSTPKSSQDDVLKPSNDDGEKVVDLPDDAAIPIEPKKVIHALIDPRWIKAMQDELLQFKLQQVWTLVDLPYGKRAIRTKWVYRNKKDERGFEDLEFPDRVYRVEKALYGLHQAPRAWYETLSTYFLDNRFERGQIEKTLFIKKVKVDILLVQVYVDDFIFRSTKKVLCTEFEKMMHKKFQMSSMGELTFFLGLDVFQKL
ncbi:putative ribonuclease H-like domain-containing protein [Tanacetum coccineum]|uniref:Ribonuclease H-like domain-containing protein n=1 Tax=Tanacetum coccineum TaxID=301880 RepID=A0ABQ4ZS54_9ASTR